MAEISYTKTNWVNNVTKLNADNMNHIENGIEAVTNAINDIKLDNYLPLTGGTISGDLTVDSDNNGVVISNSGIMFSPGSSEVVYLRKSSCESLSDRAYIHQYKLIKGPNILIVQHGSDTDQLTNNPIGVHATDGQIGYFYNGTTTEPVLVKKLYDSQYGIPTGIQCLNFAEQVVTTFEYDQTTVTDILIK